MNKEQIKEYDKRYYQKHKEKIKRRVKQYQKDHKEEIKTRKKQYRQKHREEIKRCIKQYRQDHKKEINRKARENYSGYKGHLKQYRQEHKEEINERDRIRRQTDLRYNLNRRISSAIYQSLRNGSGKQGYRWETLVGYTVIQLKRHLKRTMPAGYSWQDYLEGNLHIDHKFPISIFKFTSPEDIDFQRCWALGNLQLLPAKENRSKGARLLKPFQKCFSIQVEAVQKEKGK